MENPHIKHLDYIIRYSSILRIFSVNGTKLNEIREQQFPLESETQRLTEANLNDLFELDFVKSEFELHGLRIDTLVFDDESKAFVIIEYKKDRNFSVVDQGMAYLNLMLNNKADFILEYNEGSHSSHSLLSLLSFLLASHSYSGILQFP